MTAWIDLARMQCQKQAVFAEILGALQKRVERRVFRLKHTSRKNARTELLKFMLNAENAELFNAEKLS